MADRPELLLIDDGSAGAFAATLLQRTPSSVLLWHPTDDDRAAARRLDVVRERARLLGVAGVITARMPGGADAGEAADEALLLVLAARSALAHGCRAVVWPRQVGLDADEMEGVAERALLCRSLLAAAGGPDLLIDLPILEFEDDQVIDVIDDAGAPVELFWPCEGGEPAACGQCPGCARWRRTFEHLRIAWPWPIDEAVTV